MWVFECCIFFFNCMRACVFFISIVCMLSNDCVCTQVCAVMCECVCVCVCVCVLYEYVYKFLFVFVYILIPLICIWACCMLN